MQVNHNLREHYSTLQSLSLSSYPADASSTYLMEKSPFPALDVFIESVASIGNVSGGCNYMIFAS